MVRCEYCGQLYEGLSCPHCCAPRGESEENECVEPDYDSMTFSDFSEILDGIKETCDPEWILTNSSCVGNNNVQVIGNNNVVNGRVYADDTLYLTLPVVCDECTTDACDEYVEDELVNEKVDDIRSHHAETMERCKTIGFFALTWFGTFSLGVIIGAPVGFAAVVATVFHALLLALCIGVGNGEDNDI